MKNSLLKKEIGWLLNEKYQNKITDCAKKDIEKLKKGEPVDYLIGFVDFLGCRIDLSSRPLIPRPETEYWVEHSISDLKKEERKLEILDMFSGSGCIGIAVLKYVKRCNVEFAEKDKKFLKQISVNLKLNGISKDRYKITGSDVFKNIKSKYDYIFANPPYIAKKRINKVQKSVLKYEPKRALFGGEDGLYYIKRFLKEAVEHVKRGGRIYMEFDSPQKRKIEKILKNNKHSDYRFYKDQYGKWRCVEVRL